MIENRNIICNSFVVWDEHWGTPQQLMSRLAPANRILYIEPPISPLSFFTGIRSRSAVWNQVKRWRQGPRQARDNVWVASPPPVLPLRSHLITNRVNAAIMRRWLASLVRRLQFTDPIYWNAQPTMPGLADAVSPGLKLFHCVDDFSALPHWWHAGSSTADREEECCREADVVICTAQKLQESRSAFNSNTHFVPNAANIEVFLSATEPVTQIPPDIGAVPGPVIGIFGVIDFRTDVALIERLARSRPDWSFVLVGLVKGDVDLASLRAIPNVHVLGRKSTESLAGYLKAMDVCLIAYALIDYNHHVFPLKLYDYMAAGKPIVASAMEELQPIAGAELAIARTDAEWIAAIEAALASDSPDLASARQRVAMANSWDSRVEEISEIIGTELARRRPDLEAKQRPVTSAAGGR